MGAERLIAVLGISLLLAPLSYAQHGGGHAGGGFSGRGGFSSGHSSARGRSSRSSSRFVLGIRPIIGIRPSAPLFLRQPPFRNPCFGHAFCSGFGFGFGSPLVCDPLFGFGRCLPFFGLTFGFQGDSLTAGAQPQDVASSASDLGSTPTESSTNDAVHAITLLRLKSGWMYGLTDYWVEGNDLHYVTNYGGKNSIPLDQIDLATTIRLNSERGVEFSLHTKPESNAH
jgi:hypothetical protein